MDRNKLRSHKEDDMQEQVKEWLEQGKVDFFLGYKIIEGHPLPHFFSKENLDEVNELITGQVRYPLEKIATKTAALHPDMKIGLLVRDCNQRALNVLYVWNQLNPENVETISVNCCPSKLKEHADCSYLEPQKAGPYKKKVGVDNNMDLEEVDAYDQQERFTRWIYEFQKCIKCYGCRNICPVCFCKECSLEHDDLINTGDLPPEIPIFHLVRAVHMAGRCIDCGLCEDACPVDIPLRLLYKKVNEIVADVFDYQTGISPSQSPFNILGEKVTLELKPISKAA
jgi:formate dehydrogenase (coenzyme F420) beta subunit